MRKVKDMRRQKVRIVGKSKNQKARRMKKSRKQTTTPRTWMPNKVAGEKNKRAKLTRNGKSIEAILIEVVGEGGQSWRRPQIGDDEQGKTG